MRAVKILPNVKIENIKKVRTEIEIMSELDHPHIVRLFEYFYENGNFYLVMELCHGGDIFDKILEIGNFTEQEARILFV
jgi:calcium-dependent protein kinase